MTRLGELLERYVDEGAVPGAVALVARGGETEVAAVGFADVERARPLRRDAIFRIASLTKPLTAAAVLQLVDDGVVALDDPVARWLPELAAPHVVRTPEAPIDDVVPAARPITVFDLLTSRAGYGFPADFSLPAVAPLLADVQRSMESPDLVPPPDEWLAALARVPLLHQPGAAWLYNTCSDLQGVLVERAAGRPFADVLAERLLEPLGMNDTGFAVPDGKRHRFASYYGSAADGGLELREGPDGRWGRPRAFASGAGGLVSTVDDWHRFAGLLLGGGAIDGRRLLSVESVRLMTTNHLTETQRAAVELFLEGQGWGFGGSVDVDRRDPWTTPGRYGWVGGTGTAGHVTPATGTVSILLTQVAMAGPTPTPLMRDVWRHAAAA